MSSDAPVPASAHNRTGLEVPRRFTVAGVDPLASFEWELRDSRIVNPDGSVVFELTDVEVPTHWDQGALDIVASKYFRKAGVPQVDANGNLTLGEGGAPLLGPERSVRQVAHRLANAWRVWGERGGYFASPADAEAFYDELLYMIVAQMAAPNSPQWFNTGLFEAYGIVAEPEGNWYVDPATGEPRESEHRYERSAANACFILAPEDELVGEGSIMRHWENEARLFKSGSGSGGNFSKIREAKAPLSAGGTSSGVMSFLKVGDVSAGSIKSGGTTRRAAKMVILDADHPDIEEFIWCKAREEEKVAALVAGGYSADWQGEAYETVAFQNANHSVRLPAGFMASVASDGEWSLLSRVDGSVVRRVRARDVWHQIAEAAWRSADPGVQFDDILNDWNTVADTERVRGTNPCFTADTIVHTTKGLISFGELMTRATAGEDFGVYTHDATAGEGATAIVATTPEAFMVTGRNPIVRVEFDNGMHVRCTPNHRFWTTNRGWVRADELTDTDDVHVADSEHLAVDADWEIPVSADPADYHQKGDHNLPLELPGEWSEDLAHYLGWLVGDGSVNGTTVSAIYGSAEDREEILPQHLPLITKINGGREPKLAEQPNGTVQVRLSRRPFRAWLEAMGMAKCTGPSKRVPWTIFQAPPEVSAAFLAGLFDADGCVCDYQNGAWVQLTSTSWNLLVDAQRLLTTFGINSKIWKGTLRDNSGFTYTAKSGEDRRYQRKNACHTLRITGTNMQAFSRHIGFRLTHKAEKLAAIDHRTRRPTQTTTRMASRTDDGVELTFNLTEPRNHSYMVNGLCVSNCSEFTHVDNTACNLASINLGAFYDAAEHRFDVDGYVHACRMWTAVLEITVAMSHYPTREVAVKSYAHRPLGLGVANLGATLMRAGLAYDSDQGRAAMGAFTALLHSVAYATSAELAAAVGPADAFAENRGSALRVLRNHRRAAYGSLAARHGVGGFEGLTVEPMALDHLTLAHTPFSELSPAVTQWADQMVSAAERSGLRNLQVSVAAPTGTISFVMGCDTTGIEPDFSLVKFKKLAGGGYMRIVNGSVPAALAALGYTEAESAAVMDHVLGTRTLDGSTEINSRALAAAGFTGDELDRARTALVNSSMLVEAFEPWAVGDDVYERLGVDPAAGAPALLAAAGFDAACVAACSKVICGHATTEGAPGLRPEHAAVFDCAVECGDGTRVVSAEGHVRALGAIAPFLSGSASKTVNLPNSATVADIEATHDLAYRLGVKCVAVYRDGSKLSQPLSAAGRSSAEETVDEVLQLPTEIPAGMSPAAFYHGTTPPRFKLPDMRPGLTWRFTVGGEEVYLRSGEYADGSLGEVFIDWGRQGSTLRGITASLSIMISQALQHGVPLEKVVGSLRGHMFEPAGIVSGHANLKMATSLVDAIVRILGHHYLGRDDLVQVRDTEPAPAPAVSSPAPRAIAPEPTAPPAAESATAPVAGERVIGKSCTQCGSEALVRTGSCNTCTSCGSTTGCA